MHIQICVPTSGQCKTQFAYSLAGMVAHAQSLLRPDGDRVELTMRVLESSVVASNRERLVVGALEANATHVLFLDDDMLFPPDALAQLLAWRHPIVGVNYLKRGWPAEFVAVRADKKDKIITGAQSHGLEEAAYTGFGVCLIERKVFEQTPAPWFEPIYFAQSQSYSTEDAPFFERARRAGFQCLIDHNLSKQVGHIGGHVFTWEQYTTEVANGERAKVDNSERGDG